MSLAAAPSGFLSPTGVEIAFVLVGIATVGAALVTVSTKQLVHAALWLVVTLGGLAVEYLLLTAEFIAWVQVLIYVGSVVVLLLFGLMLTKAPIGRSPDADSGNRWAALVVAVASATTLVWVVVEPRRGRSGLRQGHRADPLPALGAALRGAVRPAPGRAGRRDRALPQDRPEERSALMHLVYPAVLSALLFSVGLYGVLARRNAILVLMSLEVMLNAVNLNLVAFDVWLRDTLHAGQALTLFVIVVAAAEIGIGLAIVLLVYRNRGTSDVDRLTDLADSDEPSVVAAPEEKAEAAA
jgi:NADH:ubiquinone oxidoreductase subunit K/NADH:ubiquinone oxidoreductase subunit 6 (subunit J)